MTRALPLRPGRRVIAAVLLDLAHRLGVAWVIALPFGAIIGGSGLLEFPDGDGLLFAPGAFYLLELLARERAVLTEAAVSALWPLFVAAVLGVVPLWVLLTALKQPPSEPHGPDGEGFEPGGSEPALARAARQVPGLLLIGGLSWLFKILLASFTSAFALSLHTACETRMDERSADLLSLVPFVLALLPLGAVAVLRDVARVLVVQRGLHSAAACFEAWLTFRRRPRALARGFVPAFAATLGVLALGHALVSLIPVTAAAAGAQGALVLHQLTLLAVLAIRALWFGHVVALVASGV